MRPHSAPQSGGGNSWARIKSPVEDLTVHPRLQQQVGRNPLNLKPRMLWGTEGRKNISTDPTAEPGHWWEKQKQQEREDEEEVVVFKGGTYLNPHCLSPPCTPNLISPRALRVTHNLTPCFNLRKPDKLWGKQELSQACGVRQPSGCLTYQTNQPAPTQTKD